LGQILLWDTRAKSHPVQYTPVSLMTHNRAIHCLSIIGSPKAHHIISLSMDGLMCAWSLECLKEPVERLELTRPNYGKIDEITPLSMAFPPDNIANFLLGSEEGTIYHAHRFDCEREKAGVSVMDTYCGHEGPVFGLQFCNSSSSPQLQDIFLSCGADFTVCLWRSKVRCLYLDWGCY
jgi:dynein intermediate chain, cytosolic